MPAHIPLGGGQRRGAIRLAVMMIGGALLLTGCSSSFGSGGGSQPARPSVVVLPAGEQIVCADGHPPPCN